MSMLDAFFNKGSKGAKCKTLLKLTIPRIKLLRNRREIQLKQMRRGIAKLLENGQEATARIRVEHIIREENMMAAQEIIELFCELIAVRLPIIETQRECPLDLKEAISSICFAAPRCSDLPELQQVQMFFAAKYGKEFVTAASELMPDCGVNRQIIELLSVRAPPVETKLKLLKEIAEEHELDWDPAASETEFLKPHEDLLNGPNHFVSMSMLPLPKEKHDDSLSANPAKKSDEEPDTDAEFDSLNLPEVPRVSVRASSDIPSTPKIVPPRTASLPHHLEPDHEVALSPSNKDEPHTPCADPDVDSSGPSLAYPYTPDISVATRENKQFIPFVSSPSLPSILLPGKQSEPALSFPQNKSEANLDSPSLTSVDFSLKQSEPSPSLPQSRREANMDSSSLPSVPFSVKRSEPASSYSRTKSDFNMDFQDVLAAAHAAAETAERAAAAARTAASLAQVRITELIMKRSNKISDSSDNEYHVESSDQLDVAEKSTFDQQNSFGHISHIPVYEPAWRSGSPTLSSHDVPKIVAESPDSKEQASEHQTRRSTSLEDDPYFSYPNLFTSQDSNLKSDHQSFTENSRSAKKF